MAGKKSEKRAATSMDAADGRDAQRATVPLRDWERQLEVIGAELFLRYRKRLTAPGIAREIRRDYPGLSLADVLVRVHAGRCILEAGDDFVALAEIRSGHWQRDLAARGAQGRRTVRADRLSRWLVSAGRLLFVLFCALSLLSVQPDAPGPAHLLLGLVAAAGVGLHGLLGRRRVRCAPAARAGRRGGAEEGGMAASH